MNWLQLDRKSVKWLRLSVQLWGLGRLQSLLSQQLLAQKIAPAREDSSRAPGAAKLAPGVLTWVAAEGIDGYKFGDSVEGVTAPLGLGANTVHTLRDSRSLFCICINDATAQEFNCRAVQKWSLEIMLAL